MVFPTLTFLLFYLVVWPLSWGLVVVGRHTLHKLAIIAASYYFYAYWSWRFAVLLFASVLLNWSTGWLIERWRGTPWQSRFLAFGVAFNLTILGFFKYFGWFSGEMNALLHAAGLARDIPLIEIVLPIGISFFTFQGISYIVDLHRGDLDRARALIDVMFFISFFPHLVAGPIVRASAFLPQLDRPPRPGRVFVSLGVMLIGWGLFKKSVVAHWLAVELVDKAFFDPTVYGAIDLAAAVYGYAVQIYCDFSAYSDIAIGVAALLGYRFQRNFNQPYRAQSLSDFWRRWHMSLSSWLRDYLYIPLGGSRGSTLRTYRNLILTMVLGGIWHGAAGKYFVWGALHGGILALERMATARHVVRPPWQRFAGVMLTFHFVCFCWIFFRAENMTRAGEVLAGLGRIHTSVTLVTPLLLGLIGIGLFVQFTPADMLERLDRVYQRLPVWMVGLASGIILLAIELVGGDATAPFIYFQF